MTANTQYEEYFPKVKSYVHSHVRNYHDAEDLVSDIFLKVSMKIHSFDPAKSSISTWIYTITKNTVCDYYRQSTTRGSREDDIDKVSISEKKNIFVEENLEALHQAISQLSEKERDLIILRFYYGYEPVEIAKMMDVTYSNVCVMQHRAVEKLKKLMKIIK